MKQKQVDKCEKENAPILVMVAEEVSTVTDPVPLCFLPLYP